MPSTKPGRTLETSLYAAVKAHLERLGYEAKGEVCGCDLTDGLGLAQPTVSHHLKKLHDAGLLEREQRGKWAYYSLKRTAVAKLAAVADLKEACC